MRCRRLYHTQKKLLEKHGKDYLFPAFAIQKIKLILYYWKNKNIPKSADNAGGRSWVYKLG